MSRIVQLPPHVVNKIAAGEVIERPASVVKELMENAIDAGATRIDVALGQGGVELARIVDNGGGLAADELPWAVASHATSKITSDEDLFSVGTLGFRGEALASIAAVSRLSIRSRPTGSGAGAEIEVVGGLLEGPGPCGCPTGTTVEVRQLFFNTPVRRKFLRSTQTELGHACETFTRLALGYPEIHFTLSHNERTTFDLPPVADLRDRIAVLFDRQLAAGLIEVQSVDGAVELSGFVANPECSRPNNRMQYLFLNGRAIRDRGLQHALGEAYRGLLLSGRHPISFLRLSMPPEMVDVNVHPTKLEVRFQDSGRLYSQLLGTLRSRFLTTDLTARLQPAARGPADAARAAELRQGVVDWATAELARRASAAPGTGIAEDRRETMFGTGDTPRHFGEPRDEPLSIHRLDPSDVRGGTPTWADRQEASTAANGPAGAVTSPGLASAPASPPAMQVLDRYVVAETDDGMIVIDQHALHERILYEQLRAKVNAGGLETQSLLVPETVDLAAAEASAVLEATEMLERLGVGVSTFGGSTVLVERYPAMLANFRPAELLRSLAERLLAGDREPDRAAAVDELMHMIACKAAIKAGDRLSAAEIAALLAQRDLARDAHHCPHGRPTSLLFTREELDRQFKRT